jgi:hypothetical protein
MSPGKSVEPSDRTERGPQEDGLEGCSSLMILRGAGDKAERARYGFDLRYQVFRGVDVLFMTRRRGVNWATTGWRGGLV